MTQRTADRDHPTAATPLVVHLARGREWRGGERQVALLVRALTSLGEWSQQLVTATGGTLGRAVAETAVPVVTAPWRFGLDPRVVTAGLRCVPGGARRMVFHAHDSHALAIGIAAARICNVPLIATRRSTLRPGPAWRLADRVIAVSAAVGDVLRAGRVPAERIAIVPSGVDFQSLGATGDGKARAGPPAVIAVGALTREKGHATLIRAFAQVVTRHPGASLSLLGEGPERAALERLARDLGVVSRVLFAGEVPSAPPLVAAATLLVQPSLREALGTAVLEAMAVGTPVIASEVGGLAEVLGGGAGVLVPPGDPGALADAIIRLIEDPVWRDALRRNARERVRGFDVRGMAEQCAEVYRSALIEPGP